MKEIEFIDAQEMHNQNPKTFSIPSQAELDVLQMDDLVKVCCCSERFWVKIIYVDNNKIRGIVDNDIFNPPFKYGDTIDFEKKNVYAVYLKLKVE